MSSLLSLLFPPGNTSRRQWVLTLLAVFLIMIPSADLGRDVAAPAVCRAKAEAQGLDTSSGPQGSWEYWTLYKRTRAACTGWSAAGGVVLGIGLCMFFDRLLSRRDQRSSQPKHDLERWLLGTYANFALYYACFPDELEEKGPWKSLSRRENRNAPWLYQPGLPLYLGGRPKSEGNRNMVRRDLQQSWNINTLQDLLDSVAFMSAGEGFSGCPDQAARAWQLCRSTQLLGQAYLAGWLTREEMVRRSCAVGRTIQGTFRDWEELTRSYLEGYTRWAFRSGVSQGMLDWRRRIQEDLWRREDCPWRLPWLLPLEPERWEKRRKLEQNLG